MSQQILCFSFRVSRQTVSNIVKEVCIALHDVLHLRAPSHENEWRHIADDFETLWNLPHCSGVIDGKHVGIDCPKYYNYKGFFYHDTASSLMPGIIFCYMT